MKTFLQIAIIALLLALGTIQILFTLGILGKDELITVCPVNAISMENSKAKIDVDKCIGCRRCVIGVPPANTPADKIVTNTSAIPAAVTPVATKPDNKPTPDTPKTTTGKDTTKQVSQPVKTTPKYTVDPKKCIGCTLCVSNCPVQAITMVDGKAVIDTDVCISCDICVSGNKTDFGGCPVQAISRK